MIPTEFTVVYFTFSTTLFLSFAILIREFKYYSWIPAQILLFANDVSFYFYEKNFPTDVTNQTLPSDMTFFTCNTILVILKGLAMIPGLIRFRFNITAISFAISSLSSFVILLMSLFV